MARLTTDDGYPPRRGLRTIAAHLAPRQGGRLPLRTAGVASSGGDDGPSVLSDREEALYDQVRRRGAKLTETVPCARA